MNRTWLWSALAKWARVASPMLVATAGVVAGCGDGSGRQGTDVQVTAGAVPDQVAGGATIVYTMSVANVGGYTANDVAITSFGGNLTGTSCAAFDGATCPATLGPSMTVGSMPAGSRLEFQFTVSIPRGANGAISNTMSASLDNDTDRGNNSVTASSTAVSEVSEVLLEVTSSPASATGGGTAEFVYTLRNQGPDAATGVRVIDTVGSNLALVGVTCTPAGGATCPTQVSAVMDVPSLPSGGSLVFNVTTQVVLAVNGTVTNTMAVTADSDSDRSNNTAVGSTAVVTPVSGLSVTGIGPTSVAAGTSATFRMTLVNTGPDPAAGVRVIDTLGGNLTLTGIACAASGGATCPAALGPLMDVVNLPVGGTLVFDVSANVQNGTNGTVINTMTATTTSGARQEVVGVGTGTAYANNLRVVGTPPLGPVTAGTTATFTMEVRNDGPSAATNAALSLVYGPGLSESQPIVCTASGGAVCPSTLGVAMTAPQIPSGGSLSFSIPAAIASGTNALVSLTFGAVVPGDSFPGDNAATASVRAQP